MKRTYGRRTGFDARSWEHTTTVPMPHHLGGPLERLAVEAATKDAVGAQSASTGRTAPATGNEEP